MNLAREFDTSGKDKVIRKSDPSDKVGTNLTYARTNVTRALADTKIAGDLYLVHAKREKINAIHAESELFSIWAHYYARHAPTPESARELTNNQSLSGRDVLFKTRKDM